MSLFGCASSFRFAFLDAFKVAIITLNARHSMRDFLGIGFTTIHTHVRHSPEFTTFAIARRTAVIPVVHYFVARGINALDTPKAPVEIDTTITNATFGITAFQWRIGILDRTHVRLLKVV